MTPILLETVSILRVRYSPLRPYEVPVRVAVGLLPASLLHGLVDGVGEGGLELDGTAPRPPLISHFVVVVAMIRTTPTDVRAVEASRPYWQLSIDTCSFCFFLPHSS